MRFHTSGLMLAKRGLFHFISALIAEICLRSYNVSARGAALYKRFAFLGDNNGFFFAVIGNEIGVVGHRIDRFFNRCFNYGCFNSRLFNYGSFNYGRFNNRFFNHGCLNNRSFNYGSCHGLNGLNGLNGLSGLTSAYVVIAQECEYCFARSCVFLAGFDKSAVTEENVNRDKRKTKISRRAENTDDNA